ncbi:hypothetical protein ACG3JJ_07080 [Streptococcus parauberis]|uniref:hypothetical protein n=1 Tax=Streptococcus parauberis TaxID=1348 RepID=UPI000450FC10|nr:hypothetical protein [Streptococcus parauberis]UWM91737.1 hypothetical protein N2A94_03665 [Streptococcus parauberis]WEM64001.1 hypothetical protein P1T44_04470 [Streptococcus parauberis]GAJ60975.1 hypothetical protein SS13_contig00002-0127 [Streptococcus parauberis]
MNLLDRLKKANDKKSKNREIYIEKNRNSYLEELQELQANINQLKVAKNPNTTRLSILKKRKDRVENILNHDI